MKHMHQRILKYGSGDQKYLRYPYLWDKNFDILCREIALDKENLVCAETVKYKPTVNNLGLIT